MLGSERGNNVLFVFWLIVNVIFLILLFNWLRQQLLLGDLFIFPFVNKVLKDNNIDVISRVVFQILFTLIFLPALIFYFFVFIASIVLTAGFVVLADFIRKLIKK
jgi:hypothetical protein